MSERENCFKTVLGKFELYTMSNNDEFFSFLKRVEAKGLEIVDGFSNEPVVITSLECVIPNSYYQINASHLLAIKRKVFWIKVKDVKSSDISSSHMISEYMERSQSF